MMLREILLLAALGACAASPAGRGALSQSAPEREPEIVAQPSPPQETAPRQVEAEADQTPVPLPEATRPSRSGEDEVVVPGQTQRRIPPPDGDPRSLAERREDVRAWDECVMDAQSAFDDDPLGPQLQSPEERCRRALGMSGRGAIPNSRR
jgi:hypothetical protein